MVQTHDMLKNNQKQKTKKYNGTWVAQLVEQLTLDFDSSHNFRVGSEIKSHVRLCTGCGTCSRFSLPLPPTHQLAHAHARSQNKTGKPKSQRQADSYRWGNNKVAFLIKNFFAKSLYKYTVLTNTDVNRYRIRSSLSTGNTLLRHLDEETLSAQSFCS